MRQLRKPESPGRFYVDGGFWIARVSNQVELWNAWPEERARFVFQHRKPY